MSKALKILENLIFAWWRDDRHQPPVGQVVLRQSEETRKELQNLTSDELSNIRPETIWGTQEENKEWNEKHKIEELERHRQAGLEKEKNDKSIRYNGFERE